MAEDGGNAAEQPASDPNPCPICLAPVTEESYLDQCFHKFCYNCILRWTKVVKSKQSRAPASVKCPLCKTENFSIIRSYGGRFFQQHYVNENLDNSMFFTKAHKYRFQCYYTNEGGLFDKFNVPRYWKLCKYLQPNPWLISWLRREIQAVTQEEDVDIIVHHILGVIDSFRRNEPKQIKDAPQTKQEEFKIMVSEAARPFLTGRTDRFVNELELFLASSLTIDAFDSVYIQHLGWKTTEKIEEGEIGEPVEQGPLVPYLYFFDEDSDGNE
ncbi:PREDICTED: uncharacterized protein LOC109209355 [Nicotiana attenuata]|uniref:RING-type domain-containing protein n=1 Tax=Nicotiana attenuata TaxID=49451 RepID=A0A314KP25_NICAT|nr:PREDICTED: uncharacterized protein LOC109209355 [Nicotiana attenuata]OIT30925.1 hypothetical protein A4A49_11877 [Nicotiana attenuata]